MAFESRNPATGQKIAVYPEHSEAQVEETVSRSVKAWGLWRWRELNERAKPMRRLADILRGDQSQYAGSITEEMGKPLSQAEAEVEKCAAACEYYAENAGDFLKRRPVQTDAVRSFVTFEPLGPLLAIMPWNFPFWQVFRAAVPALMAGNTVLLKHAPNVPKCALLIGEAFTRAGFSPGVMQNFFISNEQTARVIAHPAVKAVTFTGSTTAGSKVAAEAGRALKKTVLELGGNDPYVVLEDADLESAARICTESRLHNCGQSCIAAKRFIVVESVVAEFERLVIQRMREQIMGDPLKSETTIGPMARADLREKLHQQVTTSAAKGAKILIGGKLPDGPGYFYPPTVLADVRAGMPVYEEETFGPVAAIIRASGQKEAVRLANDTSYGLGAGIFTRDRAVGEKLAAFELDAGSCFVNSMVRSDVRLPFGGIKSSGFGRELSTFGMHEFTNIKTVYIADTGS